MQLEEKRTTQEYYSDFDVFNRVGLHPNPSDKNSFKQTKNNPVFKLIYKADKLDSILIKNYDHQSPYLGVKVNYNDSVSVYEAYGEFEEGGGISKTYFVLTKNEAVRYTETTDGWYIDKTNKDSSFKKLMILSNDRDTVNFKEKLLLDKKFDFIPMPPHGRKVIYYEDRLDNKFTFARWLKCGVKY